MKSETAKDLTGCKDDGRLGLESATETQRRILPTRDLLSRVAKELDQVTELISLIEHATTTIVALQSAPLSSRTLTALQEFDRVAQSVASLSGFLGALEPVQPDNGLLVGPALETITLAELAERLGARKGHRGDAIAALSSPGSINRTSIMPGEAEIF